MSRYSLYWTGPTRIDIEMKEQIKEEKREREERERGRDREWEEMPAMAIRSGGSQRTGDGH